MQDHQFDSLWLVLGSAVLSCLHCKSVFPIDINDKRMKMSIFSMATGVMEVFCLLLLLEKMKKVDIWHYISKNVPNDPEFDLFDPRAIQ